MATRVLTALQWSHIRQALPIGANTAAARDKVEALIRRAQINHRGFPQQRKRNRAAARAARNRRNVLSGRCDVPQSVLDQALAEAEYYQRGDDIRVLRLHQTLDILVVFRALGGKFTIYERSPAVLFVNAIEQAIGSRVSSPIRVKRVTRLLLGLKLIVRA